MISHGLASAMRFTAVVAFTFTLVGCGSTSVCASAASGAPARSMVVLGRNRHHG